MAVRLRLKRMGKKGRPCYRVCAFDRRNPRDGAYIESIGFYDPFVEDDQKKVRINKERAEYWLGVGAQPSETVASFLKKLHVQGLIKPKKSRKRRTKKTSAEARKRAEARKEKRKARIAGRKSRAEAAAKAE